MISGADRQLHIRAIVHVFVALFLSGMLLYDDGVYNCISYLLRGVGTQFDIDCAH